MQREYNKLAILLTGLFLHRFRWWFIVAFMICAGWVIGNHIYPVAEAHARRIRAEDRLAQITTKFAVDARATTEMYNASQEAERTKWLTFKTDAERKLLDDEEIVKEQGAKIRALQTLIINQSDKLMDTANFDYYRAPKGSIPNNQGSQELCDAATKIYKTRLASASWGNGGYGMFAIKESFKSMQSECK